MFKKNRRLIFCVFVQANLTNSQHTWPIEKFWNHRNYFTRKFDILRFLCINTQPSVMRNAVPTRSVRFEFRELAKVIPKTVNTAPVKTGPKSRFAQANTSHLCQHLVVICGSRDHMDVGIKVVHKNISLRLGLKSYLQRLYRTGVPIKLSRWHL